MGDIDEAAEDRVLQGETDVQPFMALEQADLREIRPALQRARREDAPASGGRPVGSSRTSLFHGRLRPTLRITCWYGAQRNTSQVILWLDAVCHCGGAMLCSSSTRAADEGGRLP